MIELYGQTKSEKLANENIAARQIIKEILQFNVSERQKYLIIYYLSLELEDIEKVQLISNFLKDINPNLTITDIYKGGI